MILLVCDAVVVEMLLGVLGAVYDCGVATAGAIGVAGGLMEVSPCAYSGVVGVSVTGEVAEATAAAAAACASATFFCCSSSSSIRFRFFACAYPRGCSLMSSNLIPPSLRILLLIDVRLDMEVLVSEGDLKPLSGTLLGIPLRGAEKNSMQFL